jgi:hypothetical protein
MRAMGFGLPLVINHGLVLRRLSDLVLCGLAVVAPIIMVVTPAAGGQNRGRQCGAQKAQAEFPQGH